MRAQDPAGACQAYTGEESGCQLVPDPSRDIGKPGKRALVIIVIMGAIPMCPACWAISVEENVVKAAMRTPIVNNRVHAVIRSFLGLLLPTRRKSFLNINFMIGIGPEKFNTSSGN